MIKESIKKLIDGIGAKKSLSFDKDIEVFRKVLSQAGEKRTPQYKEIADYWNRIIRKDSFSKYLSITAMLDCLNIDLKKSIEQAKIAIHYSGVYNRFYIGVFRRIVPKNVENISESDMENILRMWDIYISGNPDFDAVVKNLKGKPENPENPVESENPENTDNKESVKNLADMDQLELLELAKAAYEYLKPENQSDFIDWAVKLADSEESRKIA